MRFFFGLNVESFKYNLIIAKREFRGLSHQVRTWGWVELSIMVVRGREICTTRDHRVCHQDQPAAQYRESTPLTAAKLNKFLLLRLWWWIDLTAQSLSSQSTGPSLVHCGPGLSCGPMGEPDTESMILSFRTEEHVGPDYHRFTRRK